MKAYKTLQYGIFLLTFFLILMGCADLISESDAGACDSAFDDRDYATALEKCTSRKDLAGAYLGLGGFDFINFLNGSADAPATYEDSTTAGSDLNLALFLQILELTESDLTGLTRDEKLTKFQTSIGYFDNATVLLKGGGDTFNGTYASDLSAEESLLALFASLFSMTLEFVVELDDNGTHTVELEEDGSFTCSFTEISDDKHKEFDGHIWDADTVRTGCLIINTATTLEELSNAGTGLCNKLADAFGYLGNAADASAALGSALTSSDSGSSLDNTTSAGTALKTSLGC